MASTNYRIRLVKPDLEFEAEGDKTFVLEMLDRFEGASPKDDKGKKRIGAAPKEPERVRFRPNDKSLSVGEFIRQLGMKKHTDIVLALGYYLEKFSGAENFTPADINSLYYDAKMESSNTSQMIIQNIKRGRIMEAKSKDAKAKGRKSYVLTRTGEAFIEGKSSKEEPE